MNQKANPTLVGSFVLGAIVLLVIGIIALGSGNIGSQAIPIVTFFDGSVQGLNVGAPVTARGVRIGSVTRIKLEMDVHDLTARVPVYMELDRAKISYIRGKREDDLTSELVMKGLRAQLTIQSVVTGQLSVDLDFHPDTPATLVGGGDVGVMEVPGIKSQIDSLKEKFDDLPLGEITKTLLKTLQDADTLVASPDLKSSLASIAATMASLKEVVDTVQHQSGPLLTSFKDTSDTLRQTLVNAQTSLAKLNVLLTNGDAALTQLGKSADGTLQHADTALTGINSLLGPGSRQRADIDQLLRNLAVASSSLKDLVDSLERNPNALILGNKR